jgi:group I intron endonuclease
LRRTYSTNSPVVPVKIYANADKNKLQILKENKGKAGVYRFTNKENGQSYVGSSTDLGRRMREYFNYNHLISKNMIINKALLKYGCSSFSLEIMEYCESSEAVAREQNYLDLLKPAYNILPTAGSSLGFKHSEETIAKFKCRKHSDETKAKFKCRKHSDETKAKMRAKAQIPEYQAKRLAAFKVYFSNPETIAAMVAKGLSPENLEHLNRLNLLRSQKVEVLDT